MTCSLLNRGLIGIGLCTASWVGVASAPTPARAQVSIEVEVAPPVRVERYPRTWYDDREVYLVDGRWYYRRGPRWYAYREEPRPLREHRVIVVERPRHRGRHHAHRHHHHRRDDRDRRHHRGERRDREVRRHIIVTR